MEFNLTVALILISVVLFVVVSHLVSKNLLLIKYAILWFILSIALVILSIFPSISYFFSDLFGFEKPSNFIFFSLIGILMIISLSFSISLSKLNKRTLQLIQIIAINESEGR